MLIVGVTMALIILVLIIAGITFNSSGAGLFLAGSRNDEIKIGWEGPLNGTMASFGRANMQGIALAVDEINSLGGINGKKLVLIIEDTKGEKVEVQNAYQKLSKVDNVSAIFLTGYSDIFTLAPLANEEGQVILSAVDASEEIAALGEWSFGMGIYDEGVGKTIANFAYNILGAKTTAIMFDKGDGFTALVKNGFLEDYLKFGGTVEVQEGFAQEENDFRTTLTKIIQKQPDTIFLIGYDNAGFAIKQAREMGINSTFIGVDTTSTETFYRNSAGAAKGMYFTFWEPADKNKSESLLKEFKEKFGGMPELYLFTATGYDATYVIAESLKKCAPDYTNLCLKGNLYEIKEYTGITGKLTMSPDGIVRTVKEEIFVLDENANYHKFEEK